MTITTQDLIATAVDLLSTPQQVDDQPVYPTSAGPRVYAPRDWPTWDLQYPALFISSPRERKESLGRNQPQYTVTSTIRVAARVSAPGDANDNNAGAVQAALQAIQRQVEMTLIGAPNVMQQLQQISGVEAQLAYNSTGEKHLGEIVIDLDMEFFQDWTDFNPLQVSTLEQLGLSLPGFAPVEALFNIPQT